MSLVKEVYSMGKAHWLSVEARESPHVEGEMEMVEHRLG